MNPSRPFDSGARGALAVGAASAIPDFVLRVPTGRYLRLNPVTKLVLAFASAAVALGVRDWTGPALILVVVGLSALLAGLVRRLLPFALATVPLLASIVVVNTFFYPAARDAIVTIGPLAPTWTGLAAALQATLRVVAFGLSAALLGLSTPIDDLLGELEARGLGRRGSMVVGAAMDSIARTAKRAREVIDSQRARGMDTEGSFRRRARGVVPLAGPVVFGAISEIEERTVALEARAFTAPGRRTILRRLPDSTLQRLGRWLILAGSIGFTATSIAGLVRLP